MHPNRIQNLRWGNIVKIFEYEATPYILIQPYQLEKFDSLLEVPIVSLSNECHVFPATQIKELIHVLPDLFHKDGHFYINW